MAETLIEIDGVTYNASSMTLPSSGRIFRNAYVANGNVIEIDMAKAKEIHITNLLEQARDAAAEADELEKRERIKGNTAAADAAAAEAIKYRGSPKAVAALMNAANEQALLAIGLSDLFD